MQYPVRKLPGRVPRQRRHGDLPGLPHAGKEKGHPFPGAYDAEMVKDGFDIDMQAAGLRLSPGAWIPTAVVNVSLTNRAGHRIPDG